MVCKEIPFLQSVLSPPSKGNNALPLSPSLSLSILAPSRPKSYIIHTLISDYMKEDGEKKRKAGKD